MASEWDGDWHNDVGSMMTLRVSDGIVRGIYHTGVGRPGADEGFPIAGIVNDDMLAFTVNFGPHGSVAAWTGRRLDTDTDTGADTANAGPSIHTLWHVVRNTDDTGNALPRWSSTLTGATVFRRTARAAATP